MYYNAGLIRRAGTIQVSGCFRGTESDRRVADDATYRYLLADRPIVVKATCVEVEALSGFIPLFYLCFTIWPSYTLL